VSLIQALILGLLQGLTEFIPVSSSAHLVLVPWLFGWASPDPAFALPFDTVLHLGTLAAVVGVFWRDFVALGAAWLQSIRRRSLDVPQSRPAWALVIGTIPAAALGFFAADFFEGLFGVPGWAAGFLIVTGLLLIAGERWISQSRSLEELRAHHALLIGLFQGLAIAPGISRSGATISAGRFLGLERAEAARFSFLLATPAIAGAAALQVARLAGSGLLRQNLGLLVAGFVMAFVSGYLIIRFLLGYLQRHSLLPFAAYCLGLGFFGLVAWFMR
jgi:undecaprenyl-diphosphatase